MYRFSSNGWVLQWSFGRRWISNGNRRFIPLLGQFRCCCWWSLLFLMLAYIHDRTKNQFLLTISSIQRIAESNFDGSFIDADRILGRWFFTLINDNQCQQFPFSNHSLFTANMRSIAIFFSQIVFRRRGEEKYYNNNNNILTFRSIHFHGHINFIA